MPSVWNDLTILVVLETVVESHERMISGLNPLLQILENKTAILASNKKKNCVFC